MIFWWNLSLNFELRFDAHAELNIHCTKYIQDIKHKYLDIKLLPELKISSDTENSKIYSIQNFFE